MLDSEEQGSENTTLSNEDKSWDIVFNDNNDIYDDEPISNSGNSNIDNIYI